MSIYLIPEEDDLNLYPKKEIGKCLDDFMILKLITKRDKNFVAKVKSKSNNEIYVMKRIDKNIATENRRNIYISREEIFLKKLDHENIVKYITSFEDNQFLYIITDYIDNGDLKPLLNTIYSKYHWINEEKLIKIFLQCLKALSFIHSCGIIFRSLKPDKILIDNNNNIKFTNFKYAAVYNIELSKEKLNLSDEEIKLLKNQMEIISNLQPYQAPEMKKGNIYDKKIDVYSLGIIFCYLAYSDSKIPENNTTISKELGNFIKKMIENNVIKRPTADEAYQELKNIYLKKYLHNTGIISCLRCITSLPNINEDFLNSLLNINPEKKDSILKYFVNFIVSIKRVKATYLNSKEDFGEAMKQSLNLDIYDFLEIISKRGCINLYKNQEFSPRKFLFLLFSLLEGELGLNFSNVEIDINNINKEGNNNQIENESKRKIANILDYFKIFNSKLNINFSIISKRQMKCINCNSSSEFYKKKMFLVFNIEKVKQNLKGELNINNAFESLDKNIAYQDFCEKCKKKTDIQPSCGLYNTSKNLIILFDRGENCKYKDFIDFGDDLNLEKKHIELFRGKNYSYKYILYGFIIRKEKNDSSGTNKKAEEYVYYTRDFEENLFTRNDGRETYNLIQAKSEGDVMALFYYYEGLDNKNKNKNDIFEKKDSQNSLNSSNNNINNDINDSIISIPTNNVLNIIEQQRNNINNNYCISNNQISNNNNNMNNINSNNFQIQNNNFIDNQNKPQNNQVQINEINLMNALGNINNNNNNVHIQNINNPLLSANNLNLADKVIISNNNSVNFRNVNIPNNFGLHPRNNNFINPIHNVMNDNLNYQNQNQNNNYQQNNNNNPPFGFINQNYNN